MFFFLVSTPQIRRITKYKHFFILGMWAYYLPIHSTSIATFYLVDIMQRQGSNIHTEIGVKLIVHLMLGKPKRKHGYLMREVEKLYSIELLQTDARTIDKIEHLLWRTFLAKMQNIHFEQAQLLISDNQEITTTTSWVEELHLAHSYHQLIATINNWSALFNLKSATKPFNVLLACTRPLITELSDKLRLIHPLLPTTSPYPTMRLEAIRSIIPISCRRYPKSV